MKIFTSEQVRQIDAYTIEHEPIASIDLMERAARQIASWIAGVFRDNVPFIFLVGPGNNGGDGLAVARMLSDLNFLAEVCLIRISDKLSPDAATNLERLRQGGKVRIREIGDPAGFQVENPAAVIVDAIFGSGLKREVSGPAAGVIEYVNSLPNLRISIDVPSGLFGEDNSASKAGAVLKADFTLALQSPSLSFFFAENQEYTGVWEVLPIGLHPEIMEKLDTPYRYLLAEYLATRIRSRNKFDHKGKFGHALLVAGSYGMMGAAVLASRACLRGGIGLVTCHVPGKGYGILQTAVPEALISLDPSDVIFTTPPEMENYTAVGVGPGLGGKSNSGRGLKALIEQARVPLVIDADALNLLSANTAWISLLPENTILTPHPKEFDRLLGQSGPLSGFERHLRQIEFAREHHLIIVLKGAHSSIAFPDGRCWFNTTGNPGMATGGSGDVLTGIILSLLGQGYLPGDAALLGVFLHGQAGDIAAGKTSEESLIAGDITESLGHAFQYLKDSQDETEI